MKIHHLFISHSWNYHDQYANLINMLKQARNFHYRDFSIPKNDPVHGGSDAKLSEAIRNQMQSCGVILVMAGVYASCSRWMEKEMRFAKSAWLAPKPIVAIEPWGNQRTSKEVKCYANEVVGWNTNSIVSAIEQLA